jgi:hypothetical protein
MRATASLGMAGCSTAAAGVGTSTANARADSLKSSSSCAQATAHGSNHDDDNNNNNNNDSSSIHEGASTRPYGATARIRHCSRVSSMLAGLTTCIVVIVAGAYRVAAPSHEQSTSGVSESCNGRVSGQPSVSFPHLRMCLPYDACMRASISSPLSRAISCACVCTSCRLASEVIFRRDSWCVAPHPRVQTSISQDMVPHRDARRQAHLC